MQFTREREREPENYLQTEHRKVGSHAVTVLPLLKPCSFIAVAAGWLPPTLNLYTQISYSSLSRGETGPQDVWRSLSSLQGAKWKAEKNKIKFGFQ
jgi:hypothetical protein